MAKKYKLYGRHDERRAFAETHTLAEYAEFFGVKPSTAKGYYQRKRIPIPTPEYKNKRLDKKLVAEYAIDHTIKEIALYFGTTIRSVESYLYRHKIPHKVKNKPERPKAKEHEMIAYLASKYSDDSVAKLVGMTRYNVYIIRHKERKVLLETKNKMKEIARLLGIKFGREFYFIPYPGHQWKGMITDEGLMVKTMCNGAYVEEWHKDPGSLSDLLCGNMKIDRTISTYSGQAKTDEQAEDEK